MDIDPKTILLCISIFGEFAIGCWLYLEKRNDKTNERIDELTKDVSALTKDVVALDALAHSAPDHEALSEVYKSINDLAKTVNQLVGENRGQTDTLRLILNQITQKGLA